MSDPRERIETEHLHLSVLFLENDTVDKTAYWWLGMNDPHEGAVPWPEVVAFAQAILAADAEWREANAPTLEELRARYPGAMVEITPLHIPGDDYLARLVTESVSVEHAAPTVGHALDWLAAKLAETEGK